MAAETSEVDTLLPPLPGACLDDLVKEVQLQKDCDLEVGSLPAAYIAHLVQAVLKGLKTKEEQLYFALTETSRVQKRAEDWWDPTRLHALDRLKLIRPHPLTRALKDRAEQLAQAFGSDAVVDYNRTGRWMRGVTIKGVFARLPPETYLGDIQALLVNNGHTLLLRPCRESSD